MEKIDEKKLPDGIKLTNFKYITNNPIPENYYITSDKAIYTVKNKGEHAFCSSPVSVIGVNYDLQNEKEYIDLEFYNFSKKQSETFSIETGKLRSNEFAELAASKGIRFKSPTALTNYIIDVLQCIDELSIEGIDIIGRSYGSNRYGYAVLDDMDLDYTNFVGLDTNIMRMSEYKVLDKLIFKQKGTLESYKKMLAHLWDNDNYRLHSIFRQGIAIALLGVLKSFLGEEMPIANYALVGAHGTGKSFFATLIQGVWGDVRKIGGIRIASDSSAAAIKARKTRLNVIPLIIDDVQELVKKKDGYRMLEEIVYNHVNSVNSEKATVDGRTRENSCYWECPQIMLGENNSFSKINMDGASSRIWILNTKLTEGKRIVKDEFSEYTDINDNYGIIAPLFIHKISEYSKTNNILKEFTELVNEYKNIVKDDKKAKIACAIQYTFNLLLKFDLLPVGTEEMTMSEVLVDYTADDITDSDELLYKLFCDRIFRNSDVYPSIDQKISQAEFDEAKKAGREIRGRIFIEDGKIKLYIPHEFFTKNLAELSNSMGLTGTVDNIRSWIDRDWAEATTQGRPKWQKRNITIEYNKSVPERAKREEVYKIIIGEVSDEFTDDKREELANKGYSEDRIEKTVKLINEGKNEQDIDYAFKVLTTERIETENEFASVPYSIRQM